MVTIQRLGVTTVCLVATIGITLNWPTDISLADHRGVVLFGAILALPSSLLIHGIVFYRKKLKMK